MKTKTRIRTKISSYTYIPILKSRKMIIYSGKAELDLDAFIKLV